MAREKVFVGMSGGVDSSVAAAVLKNRGYQVTGVFIKIDVGPSCDWREERREAMRAAAALTLPLLTFDLSANYQSSIIDYLVSEYRAGRTPNPDVRCNKEIKFGAFFDAARRRGADFIATGHYVRKLKIQNSKFKICAAKDKGKDQSYFLWTLKQEQLKYCLFPIGDYRKSEVRKLAKKFGLPNAAKPDSQGLCFLGPIDFKNFLAKFLPVKTGPVLNEKGEVIGRHRGAHFYTIGERHGFRVFRSREPLYVVDKNIEENTLTVTNHFRQSKRTAGEINLLEVNWIVEPPKAGKIYRCRNRYRAPLVPCRLAPSNGDRWRLVFTEPQSGIAPGQSTVIYDRQICLGGGIIASFR